METPEEGQSPADALYVPRVERSLRILPRLTRGALILVWRAARRELVASTALQVVGSALLALQVVASRLLLSQLLAGSGRDNFHGAIPWLIVLALVFAATALVAVFRAELQRLLSELVARFSMQKVVDAAAGARLLDFEDPDFHDRLQRASVNASIRPFQMTSGLLSVASSALGSLAVAITLVAIEPLLLVLAVVAVVPITTVSLSLGRVLYRFAVEQTPLDRERMYMQQLLTEKDPAKEVRAFDLAPFLSGRFANLYEARLTALRGVMRTRIARGVVGALITGATVGGSLGLLILFVSEKRISLAGAGAAAAALLLFSIQLQGFSTGLGALYESALFIQDFNSFVDVAGDPRERVQTVTEEPVVGKLTVRGLTFTYPSRRDPSLIAVDLDIEPGQVVALVGENGSGKTTLAKLLAALYEPQSGHIFWNGRDLKTIPPIQARACVAVLFQDFVHYFMTASANIAMGAWRRADEAAAILEAATTAGAHDFISSLPEGYSTLLGPQFLGGSDLSGGQWQRLALARAFFRRAQLVILDEPTASLDPKAEAELFGAVRQLFAGRSVLLVSHRFATVRFADHIYVLDRGRVIEHGTHDELMGRKAVYAELFTLQAASYGIPARND